MEKLKSRKFWITIIVAAYFAIMAIKEQGGADNVATMIIFIACIAVVVFGYLMVEGMDDAERIAVNGEEVTTTENNDKKEAG